MIEKIINEWRNLDWSNLKFGHINEAALVSVVFLAILFLGLAIRLMRNRIPGRRAIILPGVVSSFRKSPLKPLRHLPLVLFFLGLPFFIIALADPYDSFTKEEVIYPGRKIVLLIDASGSMSSNFETEKLKVKSKGRFYTAVAASEYFMQLRIKGKYKDLMGLIEFGSEAYVITPFTNDYENILMSIKLIGEPEERVRFTDSGTLIIKAINQGVGLFKAFDFLNAAGNAMIIISDGEDAAVVLDGEPIDNILEKARLNKIPIYFIRTAYDISFGYMGYADEESNVISNYPLFDNQWKNAVEKTGGKFYVGANEKMVLDALNDIDKLSVGSVKTTRYSTRRPRFVPFLLASSVLWSSALFLYLLFRFFRKFP